MSVKLASQEYKTEQHPHSEFCFRLRNCLMPQESHNEAKLLTTVHSSEWIKAHPQASWDPQSSMFLPFNYMWDCKYK